MENLKKLRKQHNLTMKELAAKLNLGESTISLYESGKRQPDHLTMTLLADFFNVSIDFLLGREQKQPKKIPVLGIIPAGVPIQAIEDILDYEEISDEMARKGEYFALKVQGDSMTPQLQENDIVIVQQQSSAETGDTCVIMVNGNDATIKKVRIDKNGIWLVPNNTIKYEPKFYSNDDVLKLPVTILGKAIEIRRSI